MLGVHQVAQADPAHYAGQLSIKTVCNSALRAGKEFIMINIKETLVTLASQRPLFHSEADFQHAFAWAIHRQMPNASIRLEFPIQSQGKSIHLDVWATQNDLTLAIELKYKTRALSAHVGSEQFTLTDQRAQDLGRYDFIKDIQRLEQIITSNPNTIGYAILLTNDSSYWTRPRYNQPVDADFRIEQGRILHGELKWGVNASEGTKRSRENPLTLRNQYTVTWENYPSQPSAESYGKFRYSMVEVR